MRRITAVLHTFNDGLRLGRSLETLYPCDETIVVDGGSTDQTLRVAREYGAKILRSTTLFSPKNFTQTSSEWILCLDVRESLTEGLAASLFEWKISPLVTAPAFSFLLRLETADGWMDDPRPQTRLVPSDWDRWEGVLPKTESAATRIEGAALRFLFP